MIYDAPNTDISQIISSHMESDSTNLLVLLERAFIKMTTG